MTTVENKNISQPEVTPSSITKQELNEVQTQVTDTKLNDLDEKVSAEQYAKRIDIIQTQDAPSFQDLAAGTTMHNMLQGIAKKEQHDVEWYYNKIHRTVGDVMDKFFSGLDMSVDQRNTAIVGTTLYLLETQSGGALGAQESKNAFTKNEESRKEKKDMFGILSNLYKKEDIGSLFRMSGLFQFFNTFQDEEVREAFEGARSKGFKQGEDVSIVNRYLENPYQFQQLMREYTAQPKDKTQRLKKTLIASCHDMSKKTFTEEELKNYTISKSNKDEMIGTINKYGGTPAQLGKFLQYVEQGEQLEKNVFGTIRENMLENESMHTIFAGIHQLKEGLDQLREMLGLEKGDFPLFDFFDGILGWCGFDGIDGYMDEYYVEKHLRSLIQQYETMTNGEMIEYDEDAIYTSTLESLTGTSRKKEEVREAAKAIDIDAVYALMTGENTNKQTYITQENLNILLPQKKDASGVVEPYTSMPEKEKFGAVCAGLIERMSVTSLIDDRSAVKPVEIVQRLVLFIGYPEKIEKHFAIADAWGKLPEIEGEDASTQPDVADNDANKEDSVEPTGEVVKDEIRIDSSEDENEHIDLATYTKQELLEKISSQNIAFKTEAAKERLPLMSEDILKILASVGATYPHVRVTSTFRTKQENEALNISALNSRHLDGQAFDIGRVLSFSPEENEIYFEEIGEFIKGLFPAATILIHGEGDNRHLHVDTGQDSSWVVYENSYAVEKALEDII